MKLNMKTLIIAGGVVAAMAAEAVVMLLLMPSAPKPAAGETSESVSQDVADPDEIANSDYTEEPINEFKCTNNQQESNLHLRFKVEAVVKKSERISFQEAVKDRKARIRQTVEKIVRSASPEDLNDPNLSTLKRLIREEVNKVLEKSYVVEAVIHDFSMIEQ